MKSIYFIYIKVTNRWNFPISMKVSPIIVTSAFFVYGLSAPAGETLQKREGFLSFLSSLFNNDSDSTTEADAAAATTTAVEVAATTSPTSTATSPALNLDSLLANGYIDQWLNFFGIDANTATQAATTDSSNPLTLLTFPGKTTSAATSTTAPSVDYTPQAATTSATAPPTTLKTSTRSATVSSIDADSTQEVGGSDTEFASAILSAHNNYRSLHNAPALSWDQEAYEYAQNNADNYDCSGVLTHTHGQFGENLAAGFKDGPAAVKAWYVEGETYNYQSANTYDHFTQVVWKSTTKMGCAYKDCSSTGWQLYIVCEYDPPGNVVGRNSQNVLPENS